MVVRALEPEITPEQDWQTFSVMVLSEETTFLSDVDVRIPASVSGLDKDLLAQTWHVLPMLGCNLQQPTANRLSRKIYDGLMTIGDAYHGLINQSPARQEIEALGLTIAPLNTYHQPDIQAFHQQEIAWSDVLNVPFNDYQSYVQSLRWADVVLARSLQVEQTLAALTVIPMPAALTNRSVMLSRWFQNLFESGWLEIADLTHSGILHLAPISSRYAETSSAVRTSPEDAEDTTAEITELIRQLGVKSSTEVQRRRAAKQLGGIDKQNFEGTIQGKPEAIQALINLLRTTEDDETLWTAVESLWQIDPGNPAAGVRRVRLLDLGLQIGGQTVALAVAMIRKSNQQVGVMLRVYPTGDEPYVPENLKLVLSDDSRRTYEVSARRSDLYVQLKFNGRPGESFSVQISLEATSMAEDFLI